MGVPIAGKSAAWRLPGHGESIGGVGTPIVHDGDRGGDSNDDKNGGRDTVTTAGQNLLACNSPPFHFL